MTATPAAVAAAVAFAVAVAGCGAEGGRGAGSGRAELLVAAASDVRPAFEELGRVHTARTGVRVVFTFGSSGLLAEQVKRGAPFDVFASASSAFVEDVVRAGRGVPSSVRTYAYGRLAMWTRDAAAPVSVTELADRSRFDAVSIANPAHAPYGAAAVEALRTAGVYDEVEPALVYGENVSDALRLAASGNADVAVVALSLVRATPGGAHRVVPVTAHRPIRQTLVVTGDGSDRDDARRFVALVVGSDGRRVLRRHGFGLDAADRRLRQ